jgi:hypothetical protein
MTALDHRFRRYSTSENSDVPICPGFAIDRDEVRTRLARMDDAALEQFGRAAAYTWTSEANHN